MVVLSAGIQFLLWNTTKGTHLSRPAEAPNPGEEILYDRMKTAVMGEAGGSIVYNRALIGFARHYGFQPKACRPYRAKTKGKVEPPYRAASPRRRSSNTNSLGG
jgi:hypothetical protein